MLLKRDDAVLIVIDMQEKLLPFIHESEFTVRQVVRLVRGFHILGLPTLVTEQYRKGIGPTDARIIEAVTRPESVDEPLPPIYTDESGVPQTPVPHTASARRAVSAAAAASTGAPPPASGPLPAAGSPRAAETAGGAAAPPGSESPGEAAFQPLEKMTFSCAEHPPFMEALRATGRRQALLCGIESHVCVLQTAIQLGERGFDVFLAADAVSSRSPRNVEIALRRMEREGVHLTSTEAGIFEMMHVSGTPEFKRWSRQIR